MSVVWRIALVTLSVFLFVLALKFIQTGAASLSDLFENIFVNGEIASLGFGWFTSCVVLSGSPVAAIALSLLASNTLDKFESFSMIVGSRLGASFVVLAVGFIYDLRSKSPRGGVYVGTLSFLITASVYIPALLLGYVVLHSGFLDGVRIEAPPVFVSFIDTLYQPIVDGTVALCDTVSLPMWSLMVAGVGVLVVAFKLFDLTLPTVDPLGGNLGRMATTIFRPSIAFLFGMLVTCFTLSVSVSLTLLVPLTVRGIIRRENLVPYIMGANITTFVDTLIASLLIGHPDAFGLVLCCALTVTTVSLPLVFLVYHPYENLMDTLTSAITQRRATLTVFVIAVFIVPLLLIVLGM